MKPAIGSSGNPLVTGVICALFAMLLYGFTVAPTFSWGDSADLALRLVSDADKSATGTHRDYALYRLIGQVAALLPIQDAGLRANLFTAFWGAVTVGAIAVFTHIVTRSRVAAFAAAGSLAVAHSFWLLSVIAEVYTFNAALVFVTFSLIAAWWHGGPDRFLWVAAFTSGLALVHHATGLVLVSAIAPLIAVRLYRIGLLNTLLSVVIFLLTSLPYWHGTLPRFEAGLPILDALGLKMSKNPFFNVSESEEALKFLVYLAYNFLGIGFILGAIGLFQTVKTRQWPVFPAIFWAAAFTYAGITSSIPDKFNVYVLVYPSVALLVGIGTAWVVARFRLGKGGMGILLGLVLLGPPAGYATTVWVSRTLGIDLSGARIAPFRDNNLYFLWPPKIGEDGARRFATNALKDVPQGAILIADYTLWQPILFLQTVESFRTDVQLEFSERLYGEGVGNWIARQDCARRIFLAAVEPPQYYQLGGIETRFEVTKFKDVFEVTRRCP